MRTRLHPRELAVLALLIGMGCASSRAGWGKGKYEALFEDHDLQIRRGAIHVDPATGELVLAWVGARVPEGTAGEVRRLRLIVFRDDDHDRRVDAGEVLFEREAPQPGLKVLFDDVRVRPPGADRSAYARLEVATDRRTKAAQFELRADP